MEELRSVQSGVTLSPARIWYQSFVDPAEQRPYIERLDEYLKGYADPRVCFEVHGISPPDRYLNPLTEFRCAAQVIRNAIQAEQQGYDAFVIGHFQEPGLIECRTALEIPVIGLGEATMLYACTLGRTFGLVTNIKQITDAPSHLSNYISSDFGSPQAEAQTPRQGAPRRPPGLLRRRASRGRVLRAGMRPRRRCRPPRRP